MKIEWEEGDVIPGRHVRKPGTREEWIIAYRVRITTNGGFTGNVYGVGSLADGMFREIGTKAEVAADLTRWAQPVEVIEWNDRYPVEQ